MLQRAEVSRDRLRGFVLLERELGMLMQRLAQCDELRRQPGGNRIDAIHVSEA